MQFKSNGPLNSLQIGDLIQRLNWLILVLWLIIKSVNLFQMESLIPGVVDSRSQRLAKFLANGFAQNTLSH